jgi:hypothetical protein
METTPQDTQPQGQDKLVLKSSDLKAQFIAIPYLLEHFTSLFGTTDLIAKCKAEMACIQEELLKKPQEVESEVDYDAVLDVAKEVLEALEWDEEVCINYPTNMDVDWDCNEISVSHVEGPVSLSMSRSDAEEVAKDIVRKLKGEY